MTWILVVVAPRFATLNETLCPPLRVIMYTEIATAVPNTTPRSLHHRGATWTYITYLEKLHLNNIIVISHSLVVAENTNTVDAFY
ncbi:hypothetical protein E2C01_083469 [Portunus trituberculatus]|uniref:Uncharacterized protein n=1 Tax=Portunus trituberculatus TaxID=210409 RepID=A0A5B7J1V3_PORTR|nr:hypothetical protein [Portunus trituberculatus]